MVTKNRKAITAKVRFEVFKRDQFKCQYCGRAAPEVLLRVDHIHPVSRNGGNDLLNLITSCHDCNAGKGAVELSDSSAIAKQRRQLEELAERREQLEMMVKWRQGLIDIDAQALEHAVDAFNNLTRSAITVNAHGRRTLQKLISRHGLADVLEAIQKAGAQYLTCDSDGRYDSESASLAFSKIGAICRGKNLSEDERQLYYIRGICRNRFNRCVEWECLKLLRGAYEGGASIEYLKRLAFDTEYWNTWRRWMYEVLEEQRADREFEGWREDPEIATRRGKQLGLIANPNETLEAFVARIDAAVQKLF